MNENSAQALASIDTVSIREQIHEHIRRSRGIGRTCDEVEVDLDLRHQTASPRLLDLRKEGHIMRRGKRKTRSGRNADVWVAKV